jgi:hypothetical protein
VFRFPWSARVRVARAAHTDGLPAFVLVRPDGYIAWAGDESGALPDVLDTWCGRAAHAPAAR